MDSFTSSAGLPMGAVCLLFPLWPGLTVAGCLVSVRCLAVDVGAQKYARTRLCCGAGMLMHALSWAHASRGLLVVSFGASREPSDYFMSVYLLGVVAT